LVTSADKSIEWKNVFVGDVWHGEGQSNMDFSVSRVMDAAKFMAQAECPQVRLFQTAMDWSETPLDDERPNGGRGFGFTGFHIHANMANDSFCTTMRNGSAWISGLEIPASSVPSTTPIKVELEAIMDEAQAAIPKQHSFDHPLPL
jgi:hypothetical protein